MGLSMRERKAMIKTIVTRHWRVDKAGKGRVSDKLCTTHRLAL